MEAKYALPIDIQCAILVNAHISVCEFFAIFA